MNAHLPFRAACTLALCVSAALCGTVHAEAGRVEFVFGTATMRNAQGVRPLARGAQLESGDTVLTADGRAQIRFTDGAYVSLQPNTEFAIKQYKFDGKTDGTERGVFGLLKGTMRTVTGLIGRVNKEAYEIDTPTATVGIRGTGGIISVALDGATRIIGTTGVWFLANQSGLIEIPAGRAGFAPPDQTKPPEQTGEAPQAPPAPVVTVVQVPISKAEERTSTGGTVALLDTSKPIGVVYAEIVGGALAQGITLNKVQNSFISVGDTSLSVKGNVGASGELSGFTFTHTFQGITSGQEYKFAGTLMEGGTDGTVSWGRWVGPVTINFAENGVTRSTTVNAYPSNAGFHYALGNPATQMPTTGSFTYNMIGATAPTASDASIAPGTVTSGQLVGTFTPTGGSVSMSMGFNANSQSFTMLAGGAIAGNTFSGSGTVLGATCSVSCMASIQGAFAGVGATHAGVAYSADIAPGGMKQVGGVVVLRR
ncbi:MAG: FecR domain-containing protein [Proteobacteria bacterium]|nr:FecR domain-containing protein [Pseudomonadota bacterium]